MRLFDDPFFVDDVEVQIPSVSAISPDGREQPGGITSYTVRASVEPIRAERDLDGVPGSALLVGGRRFFMGYGDDPDSGVEDLVRFFDQGSGAPAGFYGAARIVYRGVTYIVQDLMTWEGDYIEAIGSRLAVS